MDTLALDTDTLALATDTLALATDTLALATDTLAHPTRSRTGVLMLNPFLETKSRTFTC